ncbi:MAG: PKD domain-containing protein [Chitinophagales bacterium]|nr:PKD domain-containing protein [Chitinophagales bacterium]MDW8419497.1 PKD domain-containing protein [Chitinophagales bacterium]
MKTYFTEVFCNILPARVVLMCGLMVSYYTNVTAQTQTVILTSGSTWTVPSGVYSITVHCWGGGGGGGRSAQDGRGCGGGGGGAYARKTLNVTPGQVFNFSIGAGGLGNSTGSGNPGGDTWFGSPTTVLAKGGSGVAQSSSTGGAGGSAALSVGDVKYSGGNGGNGTGAGSCHAAGGGGGAAGTTGNGFNGQNGTMGSGVLGVCPSGGNGGFGGAPRSEYGGGGGDGRGNEGAGWPGVGFGGGGGGAKRASVCIGCSSQNGGNGANGGIVIQYCIAPTAVSAGSDVTICNGSSTTLNGSATPFSGNVQLLREDFEGSLPGWTSTNNSTGGTPANANWMQFISVTTSGYVNSGTPHFYGSNSDAAGSGNAGTTTLVSPVFSSVGYTTLNLSFRHFYQFNTTESANVDISTNGGATWTTLQTWTSTQGSATAFATVNINLNSYVGQPNLRIRFRYVFDWDYWWYIDDFLVSGNATLPLSYAWSPATGLSSTTVANPTASPTSTQTYTLVASHGTCAAPSSSVTVTVRPTPTATISGTTSLCQGSPSPAITFTNPMTLPVTITYNVNGGVNHTINVGASSSATVSVSTATPGTFTYNLVSVAYQSAPACTNTLSGSATITVHPQPSLTAGGGGNYCQGATVNLTATATGGTPSYSFVWSGPGGFSSTIQNPTINNIVPSQAGTYNVTVTDNNSCSASAHVNVSVTPLPTANAGADVAQCNNNTFTLSGNNPAPATGMWSYVSGFGGITIVSPTSPNSQVTGLAAGNSVTLKWKITNGTCESEDEVELRNDIQPVITSSGADMCSGSTRTLTANVGGGVWSATCGPCVSGNTFTAPVPTLSSGNFTITYNVTTDVCPDPTQTITVYRSPSVNAGSAPPTCGQNPVTLSSATALDYNSVLWTTSGTGTFNNPSLVNPTYTPSFADVANGSVTLTLTATGNGPCAAVSSSVTLTLGTCNIVWTGNANSDWYNPGNWNVGLVPSSCSDDVLIPTLPAGGPVYPVIQSSAPDVTVGNITVQANASITIQGNRKLNVCNNWTGGSGNPSAILGTGMVVMNGSAAQSMNGETNFNNLQINNNAGVSVANGAEFGINNVLDLKTGTLHNTGTGKVRFRSTAVNAYGYLKHWGGSNGTLVGNVTAELTVPISGLNQHFTSSPVNAPAFSNFGATGTSGYVIPYYTGGLCDETQSAIGSPYGKVFSWDETKPPLGPGGACPLYGWFVQPSTATAQNGRGYSIYLNGGNFSITGSPNQQATYTVSGLANTGYSLSTVQNPAPGSYSSGWQLLGNPYLAPYDLAASLAAAPNNAFFDDAAIWITSGPYSGTYQPYNGLPNNGLLAPFQGVMVHRGDGGPVSAPKAPASFVFDKSYCVEPGTLPQFTKQAGQHYLSATVSGNGFNDITYIEFNELASGGFDVGYDSRKLVSRAGQPTLSTLNNWGEQMAYNTVKNLQEAPAIPLNFNPGASGVFTITFNGINSFDPTSYVYLEDKLLQTRVNLRYNQQYGFHAAAGDDVARFVLHFTPPMIVQASPATCMQQGAIQLQQPGEAIWQYVVTDQNGAYVAGGMLSQSSPQNIYVPAGVYTLTFTDAMGYSVVKNILVPGVQSATADFTMQTSSTTVGSEVQFYSSPEDAVSIVWDFGDGTIITGVANPAYAYLEPGTYHVTLTVTSANGCTATATQTIIVSQATNVPHIAVQPVGLWSNGDKVFVDFRQAQNVDARILYYAADGRLLLEDNWQQSALYVKEMDVCDVCYIIVNVQNGNRAVVRKLLIGR